MLYANRERFQRFLEKLGEFFSKFGLSPNQWTVLSFFPALAGVYLIYKGFLLTAAVFYLLSFFIDIVDGSVARYTGRASKKGGYIDTIADRYLEFLPVFSLIFLRLPKFVIPAKFWIVLVLFGSLVTTYSKSAGKEKEVLEVEISGGLLERAERVLLLVVGIVLGYFNPLWLVVVLSILAVLTNISALQRISKVLRVKK